MAKNNDDIDVLEKPAPTQEKKYMISVGAENLPPLASFCNCELLVNQDGQTIVIFDRDMPEGIEWAEYDVDLSLLNFVTWSGKVMGLGMKVHAPFRKYMKQAEDITLIQISEDRQDVLGMYNTDLVIRHIGF